MRGEWIRALAVALLVGVGCGGVGCGGASPPVASSPRAEAETDAERPPLPWAREPESPPEVSSPRVALVGGTVMTAAGEVFEDGVVLMANGRLEAVGPRGEVEVPDDAEVVDVSGRFVTPGLIDAHSHLGVYPSPSARAHADGNEMTGPVTAGIRAADSFWPQDPGLPHALAGGVTSLLVLPGSANLIGGAGATFKLHLGRSAEEMRFPGAPETMKMACGENPKRVYGARQTAPMTRMGSVGAVRRAFLAAADYGRSWESWRREHRRWSRRRAAREEAQARVARGEEDVEVPDSPGNEPSSPSRDIGHERLLGAIEGRVLVQMHCYRADEMVTMLSVAEEIGFSVRAFHHAVEAYKVRDLLRDAGVGVATWADWWGFKLEAYDAIEENVALLTETGVRAVVHSDSALGIQRLNQEAAKALAAGRRAGLELTDDQALRWITADAAWTLGVHEQTGTLEAGKMADVVVWSGSPFSVYSRADLVFIDGLLTYEREGPDGRPRTDFELGQELGIDEAEAPAPARRRR